MTFLNHEKPLKTVMIQSDDLEYIRGIIAEANRNGADAFGLQVERLRPEQRTPAILGELFEAMGKPCYVTNYRGGLNKERCTDEDLAEGMLQLADYGATLVDVMGDLFCKHPEELTEDPAAVQKQKELIAALHAKGAEVLMSSHVLKFIPAERVLEIARAQLERGADVVKIVTGAEDDAQQVENLRIVTLLKKELKVPFLYLSAGECKMLRRLGPKLGCCMWLCVENKPAESQNPQPLIADINQVATLFNIDSAK